MAKNWVIMLVIVTLSLAACMPIQPPGQTPATAVPAEEVTPASIEEATAEPAGEATAETTEETTEEATAEATLELEEESVEEVDIQAVVTQLLAEQLQVDPTTIEVVTVEEVEWRDACLGIQNPDVMCAQVITPGYRIVLEVDGEQHEVHTNLDGSSVQFVEEPESKLKDVLVAWHREGGFAGFCDDLTAYVTGEIYASSCKNQPAQAIARRPMTAEELAQFQTWIDKYASFEYTHSDGNVADSMAINLLFSGAGSTPADQAAQQEILRFVESLYAEMMM
jgi:hypothetical protein